MVAHTCNLNSDSWGRRIVASSRPSWATYWFLGESGLQKDPVLWGWGVGSTLCTGVHMQRPEKRRQVFLLYHLSIIISSLRRGLSLHLEPGWWPAGPSALTAVPASHVPEATCGWVTWTQLFTWVLLLIFAQHSYLLSQVPWDACLVGWFLILFFQTLVLDDGKQKKM